MPKISWTPEMEEELLEAKTKEQKFTFSQKYGITFETAQRQTNKIITRRKLEGINPEIKSEPVPTIPYYEKQISILQGQVQGLKGQLDHEGALIRIAQKHVEALPKVSEPPKLKKDPKIVQEIANLLLSDLHIGEIVNADEMGGINEYNFDIYSRRMESLAMTILSIKDKMQGYDLSHLEIHALGDFITGVIHEELVRNAEDTVIEWLFNGALVMSQFLAVLLKEFKTIHFTGVVGNHGRMFQKRHFKKKYMNWDYIFYQVLALMMAQNDRITFDLPKSFWTIREVGGRKLLLLHGDNIKSWNGIPWYGVQRASYKLMELLGSRGNHWDDLCLGHFHSLGTLTRTKGKILLNGSVVGGDEFSVGALFASSDPMQLFFGINPKHKRRTWEFGVDLTDTRKATGKFKYSKTIPLVAQLKELVI